MEVRGVASTPIRGYGAGPLEGKWYYRLKKYVLGAFFIFHKSKCIFEKKTGFQIFPNPATRKINIILPFLTMGFNHAARHAGAAVF